MSTQSPQACQRIKAGKGRGLQLQYRECKKFKYNLRCNKDTRKKQTRRQVLFIHIYRKKNVLQCRKYRDFKYYNKCRIYLKKNSKKYVAN